MRHLAAVFVLLFAATIALAAGPEKALSGTLEAIEANRLDLAMQRVEALLAVHPNFRLGHLIRGDLLFARARPLETFGNVPKTVPREKVEELRAEALLRLRALRDRPNGEPRAEWEKGRRQRISAPKSIAVGVESPKMSVAADGQASVTFRQSYRSDVIKSTSTKTLVLVKADGRWVIQQERVAN